MIQAHGLCCALFFVLINPSPFQPYHRLAGVEEGGGNFEDAWAVQAAQGILDGGAVVVAVYHHHFFGSARGCRNGVAHGLQSVLHVLAVDIDSYSVIGCAGHEGRFICYKSSAKIQLILIMYLLIQQEPPPS